MWMLRVEREKKTFFSFSLAVSSSLDKNGLDEVFGLSNLTQFTLK